MRSEKPILEVNFGPHNGALKFFSFEEVSQFLSTEQQALTWLNSPPVQDQLNSPWNTVVNCFNHIRNAVQKINDGNLDRIQMLKDALEQAFHGARIPLSTSPVGAFIEELKAESPLVAAAALATWMNTGGVNWSKFEHVKGAMLMTAFDANITSKAPSAVKRSLEKLHQQFHDSHAKTERETREQRNDFSLDKSRQRKAAATMIRQGRRRLLAFREEKRQEIDTAISSIQQTEALYREHMRIKGPVEYWSEKAGTHRTNAGNYRKTLLWFSVIAGLALLIALYCIASRAIAIASTDKPPAVYLVLVTLGVVTTTIVFWAARVLTRLFLSEHHLAIDAEERAVMAQTYLALTAEGQATESERGIVLGSLFRPTADGIVKDDAAPDLSPAALLSRLGAR